MSSQVPPSSRGVGGGVPVRSRGANGCPWFSPSPLGCPSALTATLPSPFLLPRSLLSGGWRVSVGGKWGTHCSWVSLLLRGEAGRVVVGLGSGCLSLNVVLSNGR